MVTGASLADTRFAYIVDDVAHDRTEAAQAAIAAGMRIELFDGGAAFLEALPKLELGVVLLDVMMPCVDGPSVLARLRQERPEFAIVMMSAQADVAVAVKAMRSGADDFLLKPLDQEVVVATLARVNAKMDDADASVRHRTEVESVLEAITPKEMSVLRHLLAGKRNKTIAFDLGVSERTVEVHRARLIGRVKAENFAGLIAFAVKAGVEPSES